MRVIQCSVGAVWLGLILGSMRVSSRCGGTLGRGPIYTVDSKKLEHGSGTIYAGVPSCLGFGVGGQSYCNFLASTVYVISSPFWFDTSQLKVTVGCHGQAI